MGLNVVFFLRISESRVFDDIQLACFHGINLFPQCSHTSASITTFTSISHYFFQAQINFFSNNIMSLIIFFLMILAKCHQFNCHNVDTAKVPLSWMKQNFANRILKSKVITSRRKFKMNLQQTDVSWKYKAFANCHV